MAFKRSLAALGAFTLATIVVAENEPIPQPECDATKTVSVRHSGTTKRLYLEGVGGERGGCITLSQIYEARVGKPPIFPVDPLTGARTINATGTWLLTEDLFVEDGITLNVHGGSRGDVDELRLLSKPYEIIEFRAHGASLSFLDTKVFSWDEAAGDYDKNVTDWRSFITVISEVEDNRPCEGAGMKTMGEARMDIVNSEIGYLGYYASESYGLTWKVRGFCADKSNPEVFDTVNVYGNIYDSDIHHNYFGVYTYGHQQGDWRRNQMHDNIQYGFDPHDDSDYLNIHDNKVWGNGNHGIIASKRCNHVSIHNNEVYNGGQAGLFLHRSTDNATVTRNYVHDNDDAGLALLESSHAFVSDNIFKNNKYGIRLSVGSSNNVFSDNSILTSTKYNVYTYMGSDLPDVAATGRPLNNKFVGNTMTGAVETLKLKESDGTLFEDNMFTDATVLRLEDATAIMMGNKGLGNTHLKATDGACYDPSSDPGFTPTCVI